MQMLKNKLLPLLAFILIAQALPAAEEFKDLGTWGNLYEIKEEDMLSVIKKSSEAFTPERILAEAKEAAKSILIAKSDIGHCLVSRDRTFNPTKVLEQDIDLSEYGIVVKAGTSFNPLEKGLIKAYILFIDVRDALQIQLAEQLNASNGGNLMIIVTNGDLLKAQHITNEVYKIDQPTMDAFKLECAPTVYVQQDDVFFVREFALRKEKPTDSE